MHKIPKKDFFTIPNLIGYLRLALIPVFCWLFLTAETPAQHMAATGVVLFSSLTDLFDGMIARKFNQVTQLGKILDPVADKLTHAAMALCLSVRYPLMWVLLALMLVKEGYMAVMGLYFLRRGQMLDGAMWFGKVCTAVLFAGLVVLFFSYQMPPAMANAIILTMMLVTLILYIPQFKKMKKQDPRK